MVAACFANGRTVFHGVSELHFKETDRVKSMVTNLRKMGADIKVVGSGKKEGVVINGPAGLKGARVKSFGDHRTAMSMAVAGLAARGHTYIDDVSSIAKSFPGFLAALGKLIR
jgi:3-phosphoshikimate 1-carboxyvinyltransferase